MSKMITSRAFAKALVDAGVLTQDEVNRTRRIVIDIVENDVPRLYIERYGDEALLEIAPMLKEMIPDGEAVRPGG